MLMNQIVSKQLLRIGIIGEHRVLDTMDSIFARVEAIVEIYLKSIFIEPNHSRIDVGAAVIFNFNLMTQLIGDHQVVETSSRSK